MLDKVLFLLRGVPGCGKSTVATLLSEGGKYPVLSADMYFEDVDGKYRWEAGKVKDAHEWCQQTAAAYMGINSVDKIFIANTFIHEWEMDAYYELADQYGYSVVCMVVENRHGGKNVHNVPEETLDKMASKLYKSIRLREI